MAIWDRFRRPRHTDGIISLAEQIRAEELPKTAPVIVGAGKQDDERKYIEAFDSGRLTYSGEIGNLDYLEILQNKQENIQRLFQLADYYADADPLIHSIIYNVYVPFCSSSEWFLTGSNEKTIKLYMDYFKKIRLREKMIGIFVDYAKYYNTFCYLMDGNIITLPVSKVRIANTTLNGQPVLEFDCMSIQNELKIKGYSVKEKYANDSKLEYVIKGYPKEIQTALRSGEQYAQLDPANCFTMQGPKELWSRYAIPWIASALESLSRKELIKKYERNILKIASKPILHVKYGDPKVEMLPDGGQLGAIRSIFKGAMSGLPLAVTNHLADSKILTTDISHLYEWPIYGGVNKDILTAGGISDAIASGESDAGSTFSLGTLSKESAEFRIDAMRNEFCEMMNAMCKRLAEYIPGTYNLKDPVEFHLKPLDMSGRKALRDKCLDLWEKGIVSTKTLMDMHGYSMYGEKEQREKEAKDNVDTILAPRDKLYEKEDGNNPVGRPPLEDGDRTSNPDKAESSKQPKPSNPEGSNSE